RQMTRDKKLTQIAGFRRFIGISLMGQIVGCKPAVSVAGSSLIFAGGIHSPSSLASRFKKIYTCVRSSRRADAPLLSITYFIDRPGFWPDGNPNTCGGQTPIHV